MHKLKVEKLKTTWLVAVMMNNVEKTAGQSDGVEVFPANVSRCGVCVCLLYCRGLCWCAQCDRHCALITLTCLSASSCP